MTASSINLTLLGLEHFCNIFEDNVMFALFRIYKSNDRIISLYILYVSKK